MTDKERWLQINTFLCPHGLGRISPEQCAANRKRPRLGHGAWGLSDLLTGTPVKPGPCEKCTEYKELCEQVYKRREEMEMAEKKKPKKMIICAECGKEAPNHGRGLCATCYSRLKREGRLPPAIKEKTKVEGKTDFYVQVDFSPAPYLLEEIKRRADEEVRTLEMQIVWELKKAIGVDSIKVGGTI